MRSMRTAFFGQSPRCRYDRASVWPSSSFDGRTPVAGISRGSLPMPTTISLWRKPDLTSGLPPLIARTGGEARRDLVGRSGALPCAGANWSTSRHRLAKRHVDPAAPVRSGCSPYHEYRPREAGGYRPHFRNRRRPCCRFRSPGVSDARDSQGVPQDADSFAVRRGTLGTGLGDRRGGWPSRTGNRAGMTAGSPTRDGAVGA